MHGSQKETFGRLKTWCVQYSSLSVWRFQTVWSSIWWTGLWNQLVNSKSAPNSPAEIYGLRLLTAKEMIETAFGKLGYFKIPTDQQTTISRRKLNLVSYEASSPSNLKVYVPSRRQVVIRSHGGDALLTDSILTQLTTICNDTILLRMTSFGWMTASMSNLVSKSWGALTSVSKKPTKLWIRRRLMRLFSLNLRIWNVVMCGSMWKLKTWILYA